MSEPEKSKNSDFFGPDAEFDHVAIAVHSIDRAVSGLRRIGDPIQKVSVAFFDLYGIKIELVEPLTVPSPVSNLLSKGQTIYHLCYRVGNIQKAIVSARKHGFHSIARPVNATAFNEKKMVWLYSKIFGLFELIEK